MIWTKVTDRLPQERILVLAYWEPKRTPTAQWEVAQIIDGIWSCADGDRDFSDPSHWMPLPDSPPDSG